MKAILKIKPEHIVIGNQKRNVKREDIVKNKRVSLENKRDIGYLERISAAPPKQIIQKEQIK